MQEINAEFSTTWTYVGLSLITTDSRSLPGQLTLAGFQGVEGVERTARPCRPPLLTRVCKRGGRPPSAFRLLPGGEPQELAHQRVMFEADSLF